MRLLITGGAGFISSHIIEYFLVKTDWEIVVLDKFTYASHGLTRLKEIGAYDNPRVKIHVADIARPLGLLLEQEIGSVDFILHMAAGTHVDNSIRCPRDFVESNILGTMEMLEFARRIPTLKNFIYFSTDEVFGPAVDGQSFKEWDRYNSCNPYSATKAGGEELALAWANTYKVPVTITHTMNVIGERQHHEKFLPKVVRAAFTGETLQIHADASGKSGSRIYLHGKDVASALHFILGLPAAREKYNIEGLQEVSNEELTIMTAKILQKSILFQKSQPVSRPGNDMRYKVDGGKLHALGWQPTLGFYNRLEATVLWMAQSENKHWLGL
jgi:dTDP-glucose 4,6-dehydratase